MNELVLKPQRTGLCVSLCQILLGYKSWEKMYNHVVYTFNVYILATQSFAFLFEFVWADMTSHLWIYFWHIFVHGIC